jgi:hypothetical protein
MRSVPALLAQLEAEADEINVLALWPYSAAVIAAAERILDAPLLEISMRHDLLHQALIAWYVRAEEVLGDDEPDMDGSPRGGEAAAEEAHRMNEARKLK